ncbi:hypothetical protein BgiBS90_023637 [Biomphalaria glabrata]|nr:hypothetical protein BgiBS90_023637 [Biomphalaria glabrata]
MNTTHQGPVGCSHGINQNGRVRFRQFKQCQWGLWGPYIKSGCITVKTVFTTVRFTTDDLLQCGSAVWFSGVVQRCGSAVWFSGVVQRCGSAVWFSGVVLCGTLRRFSAEYYQVQSRHLSNPRQRLDLDLRSNPTQRIQCVEVSPEQLNLVQVRDQA